MGLRNNKNERWENVLMGQIAWGSCTAKLKEPIPEEALEALDDIWIKVEYKYPKLEFVLDGNYWFEDVVDALQHIAPYVESGDFDFEGDEDGTCRSTFKDNKWTYEYAQSYFAGDEPLNGVISTKRVAEIINIVVDDLMAYSDSEEARRILFKKCNLTPAETNALGLDWLKDLDK